MHYTRGKMMKYSVFDGHNDTLTKMHFNQYDLESYVNGNDKLNIDLPKTVKGNFIGGFYAIFVPPLSGTWDPKSIQMTESGYYLDAAPYMDKDYSVKLTDTILENLYKITELPGSNLSVIKTHSDFIECKKNGKVAVIVHFEGAEAINRDLSNLEFYYSKGLRSIGLVWSRSNDFANGVPFCYPSTGDIGEGLTDLGKKLVKKCDKMGIIVDLAHINEKGFFDVTEIYEKPLIVSHTGANELCRISRNLTDRQLQAVEDSNGVVGIYFAGEMLSKTAKLRKPQKLELIVQHIDYIADKFGIEHVVLGSDFDGCILPEDLKDCSEVQKIFIELKKLGYTHSDLEKIAYKNWFRVIKNSIK